MDQYLDSLGRPGRPLENATHAAQGPPLNHDTITRFEMMPWEPAVGVYLRHFGADQTNGLVRDDGRAPGEREDTPQAGDPLQVSDANRLHIAVNEQVGREQRLRMPFFARGQHGQVSFEAASHQGTVHLNL